MKKVLLLLAAAMFVFAACDTKKPEPEKPDNQEQQEPEEPEYECPITIDGNFTDWAGLDASKVSVAKNDPNSPWTGVKEIRVYADEEFVFFYIEYDSAELNEMFPTCCDGENDGLPIRLNFNTDGEFTSGYTSYSLDGYDFIIEGSLASGNNEWGSFDGNFYQRIDGWVPLLEGGNNMCSGAGSGNKYEIQVIRAVFNSAAMTSTVPMPMGDVFQAGVRFYTPDWGELSNMPNGAVTDDNPKGYGHLLEVNTVK